MLRSTLPLALAFTLAACSDDPKRDAPVEPAPRATPPAGGDAPDGDAGDTRLTIFSGDYASLAAGHGSQAGFALVRRALHFDLKAGANRVAFGELPDGIDVAATSLQPTTEGVTVGAQRYLAPLAGAQEVFANALGRRVAVDHTSGGARQTDNGILVAAGDGLTLALSDGRYKVIREFDSLSVLDSQDLPGAEPQLRWQVQSAQGGPAGFVFEYPTNGLAWRAEYVGRLSQGEAGCQLSLTGFAMVANRSGSRYEDAAITLVAGEPNRAPEFQAKRQRMTAAAAPPPAPVAEMGYAAPEPRRAGEYHAYDLPGRTTLADGGIERVPLFEPVTGVACERNYETTPAASFWEPPQPIIEPGFNDTTGRQPVSVVVAFDNTQAAGLGRPLPAGRVRVFDGEDFLGESTRPHTAAGEEIQMQVGTAFDLTAERERMAFNLDRAGRTMTERFEVRLANASAVDATITVAEPMPRWSDWTITDSSVPGERRDARTAEFEVEVPAGEEVVLAYTVRYRWPAAMRL